MKNTILKMLMSLALLGLAACGNDDDNNFANEYQSCVDFGGGCNYFVFDEFQSPALLRYPVDAQGRLEGAGQQSAGGIVYYNNLDACNRINNESLQVYGDQGSFEQVSRYIVGELPRNGGLVCIDSLALDTSGEDPFYLWNPLDTRSFYFSEFAMYGFNPSGINNNWNGGNQTSTANASSNVITKFLTLSGATNNTTTNNQNYGWGYRAFSDIKDRARSVNVPLLCNTRRGVNVPNDDCRGRICQAVTNPFIQTGPNLGICTY